MVERTAEDEIDAAGEADGGRRLPARAGTSTPVTPMIDERDAAAPPPPGRARTRLFFLLSLPIWVSTAIRAASDTSLFDDTRARFGAALLLAFAVLMVSERPLSRRFPWYRQPYFVVQAGLIVVLMVLGDDLDYFAVLYIPLCTQAMLILSRSRAYRWTGVFILVMTAGLLVTEDWPKNISLALLYGAALLFVVSYATVTHRAEAARAQSQQLLTELEDAYRRLETYATQVETLAVVEERNRLARDLHDSVTQSLYGLTLSAEAATRQLAAGQVENAAGQLRDLRETAQYALQEMRLLIFELRPPVLEHEGLAAALQARLQAVEGRVGLATTLAVEGDGRLPPLVESELDRITQEALNNALKHAQAHRIAVRLHQDDQTVALEIADDGVGFDPGTPQSRGGLGLRGMAERAARLGGRLAVESRPGEGTRVRVEVPR